MVDKTARLQGERETILHKTSSRAELSWHFMSLIIFFHPFSKTMAKDSMLESQSHLSLSFLWPWHRSLSSPIALQRNFPGPAGSAHSPAPLAPLLLCLWFLIPPGCHWHQLGYATPEETSPSAGGIVCWAVSSLPQLFQQHLAKAQAVSS